MASSGNTWQKKLMAKAKRNWIAANLGTCTPQSPRGHNAGHDFGLVDRGSRLRFALAFDDSELGNRCKPIASTIKPYAMRKHQSRIAR